MRRSGYVVFGVLVAVMVALGTGFSAENATAGFRDPPLAPRFQGLTVIDCSVKEYDEYVLPVGKLVHFQQGEVKKLAGRVTRVLYAAPVGKSTDEICDYYGQVLEKNGFKVLFRGGGEDLENWASVYYTYIHKVHGFDAMQRYLCARRSRPEGDTYVAVYVSLGWDPYANTQVDVIEVPVRK